MRKRYYIKKSKIIIFLLLFFFFNTGLIIQHEDFSNKNTEFEIYSVKSGDSLWDIAGRYDNSNKMNFILKIEKINKTTSENLKPGDKLIIPISSN